MPPRKKPALLEAPPPAPVPVETPRVRKAHVGPVRTLRVRVAEISPHHLEAFDLVVKKDEAFAESVRSALDATDEVRAAGARLVSARLDVAEAERALSMAQETTRDLAIVAARKRLDAKAALVARLHDDVVEPPDIDAGPIDASDPGPVPDAPVGSDAQDLPR